MRPNTKIIKEVFKIDTIEARNIKGLLRDTERRPFNSAYNVNRVLNELNKMLEGCGIEPIRGEFWDKYFGDVHADYINMGDTYAGTILFDYHKWKFYVTTFGDWVESNSKRYGIY